MLTKITVLLGVTTLFASCDAAADDEKRSTEYYPEIEITGLLLNATFSGSDYYKYPYVDYATDILAGFNSENQKSPEMGHDIRVKDCTSWWLDSDKFDVRHDTFVVEKEIIPTHGDKNTYQKLFVQVYDRPDGSKWIRWMTEDGFKEAVKKCLTIDRIESRKETINKCWENDISVEKLDISGVISTPGMKSILKSGLELTFPQEIIDIIGSFSETKTPLNPLLEAVLQDTKWIFKPNPLSIRSLDVVELKRDFIYGEGESKVTIKSGTPAVLGCIRSIRADSKEAFATFTGIIDGQEETAVPLPIDYFQKRPWEEIERFLLATGKWRKQDWVDQDWADRLLRK